MTVIHSVMKNINPLVFFDEHFLLKRLSKLKYPLVKLEHHIDRALFVPVLGSAFSKPTNKNKLRRPPFDRTMMLKIFILQSHYSLSDDQMECQITDKAELQSLPRAEVK